MRWRRTKLAAFAQAGEPPGLLGKLTRYYRAQASREAGMELARAGKLEAAQRYLKQAGALVGPNADLAADQRAVQHLAMRRRRGRVDHLDDVRQ